MTHEYGKPNDETKGNDPKKRPPPVTPDETANRPPENRPGQDSPLTRNVRDQQKT